MEKAKNDVVFFLFTYPAGIVIGLTFWLLRFAGVLKVRGWDNFPHWREKVLVVSNHPYRGEQILLSGLFFHQYVLRPFKYGPWSLADKKNYYDNPRYRLMRPRLIPVDRTQEKGYSGSLKVAKKVLASGANIILFPEGGRTSKGKEFLVSPMGKQIRPLKGGFAFLATETNANLLPVWFEYNRWYEMVIVIGESTTFTAGTPLEEVVERTQTKLLELADRAG